MISIQASIPTASVRIDRFLAHHYPEYTRTFLKKLIILGNITNNGVSITKASAPVSDGDILTIKDFELPKRIVNTEHLPDYCKTYLVFEHEHFLIVEKPAGLITHQPEHASDTISLADIIASQRPEIAKVGQEGRKGIVHRLDRNTSGLLIVARTQKGYETFVDLFKEHKIKKTYYAVVKGHPEPTGSITASIMRHPADPRKMLCTKGDGRQARTDYEVIHMFDDYSLIKAYPFTGRTHQIRVHMATAGHPVLGDPVYGTHSKLIKRQALHAHKLAFEFEGQSFEFTSAMPQDIQELLVIKA